MSAIHLSHIDPARNMCRFYRIDVQPDLFGGFAGRSDCGSPSRMADYNFRQG
jgi:predicted DNA-binding WGR domain protein